MLYLHMFEAIWMSPGCKINFRRGEERNSPNDTNMMINEPLLMGLIVFKLFDHYDLKSYRTRSEAIRGESPLSFVQQGSFVANNPRCRSHLCRSINSISRRTLSSTHSHTHTTTHHTNHTHTFTHNSSSVCPSHLLSFLRSLVSSLVALFPPPPPPPLSCRLVPTSRYLVLIEMISHRQNPTR
jgi:hypothetical protein